MLTVGFWTLLHICATRQPIALGPYKLVQPVKHGTTSDIFQSSVIPFFIAFEKFNAPNHPQGRPNSKSPHRKGADPPSRRGVSNSNLQPYMLKWGWDLNCSNGTEGQRRGADAISTAVSAPPWLDLEAVAGRWRRS